MKESDLIERIAAVFPLTPIPRKEEVICEGGSYPPDESELVEIREFFGGRPWNSLTPADVRRFEDCLPLLSSKAFAYHIAGWMTCCVKDPIMVDVGEEFLVYRLEKVDPNLWTKDQREVICQWLEHSIPDNSPSPWIEDRQKAVSNIMRDGRERQ